MADDDLTNVGRVDDNVNTALLTPDECVRMRLWEIDPLYYTSSKANGDRNSSRPLRRGKAYRCLKTGEYKCFEGHDGVVYNIGGIRMSKRGCALRPPRVYRATPFPSAFVLPRAPTR